MNISLFTTLHYYDSYLEDQKSQIENRSNPAKLVLINSGVFIYSQNACIV